MVIFIPLGGTFWWNACMDFNEENKKIKINVWMNTGKRHTHN